MPISLIIGIVTVLLIVLVFDLRDTKTHRWKPTAGGKRAWGYFLLFLTIVGTVGGMLLGY